MKKRIKELIKDKPVGKTVSVAGWIRTRRDTGEFSFLEVNDGSCLANMQIIANEDLENYSREIKQLTTGCSVRIRGQLKESPAKGCEGCSMIGSCNKVKLFPIWKKKPVCQIML